MLITGGSVAGAAILACFAGRAGAVGGGLGTGMNLVTTLHVRPGCDQLAIGGKGSALVCRVAREKSGVGRDELIGHQPLSQTGLAV
jgi:hypothetical protein